MPTPVLELVTFRLIPGTDPAAFAAAAEATRPLVAAQPGFRARHLALDGQGWADLVVWDSLTAADRQMMRLYSFFFKGYRVYGWEMVVIARKVL